MILAWDRGQQGVHCEELVDNEGEETCCQLDERRGCTRFGLSPEEGRKDARD